MRLTKMQKSWPKYSDLNSLLLIFSKPYSYIFFCFAITSLHHNKTCAVQSLRYKFQGPVSQLLKIPLIFSSEFYIWIFLFDTIFKTITWLNVLDQSFIRYLHILNLKSNPRNKWSLYETMHSEFVRSFFLNIFLSKLYISNFFSLYLNKMVKLWPMDSYRDILFHLVFFFNFPHAFCFVL